MNSIRRDTFYTDKIKIFHTVESILNLNRTTLQLFYWHFNIFKNILLSLLKSIVKSK